MWFARAICQIAGGPTQARGGGGTAGVARLAGALPPQPAAAFSCGSPGYGHAALLTGNSASAGGVAGIGRSAGQQGCEAQQGCGSGGGALHGGGWGGGGQGLGRGRVGRGCGMLLMDVEQQMQGACTWSIGIMLPGFESCAQGGRGGGGKEGG